MKTAMQILMDSFDDYQHESHEDSITIEKLKEVITNKFLNLEKQQIIDVFDAERAVWYHNGNHYYNETFEQ